MPHKSLRRKAIDYMQAKVDNLRLLYNIQEAMDKDDSSTDEEFIQQSDKLHKMKQNRYLFRSSTYRTERNKFDIDDALSYQSYNYNDAEFLFLFRITRDSFFLFLEEMKTKDAFKNVKSKTSHQRPVAFQLLVFLYRIGREGKAGGCDDVGQFFGIAKGSVKNYVRRTVLALLEMEEEVVYWPDASQRKEIRKRLIAYGFRHCVGIIDGTLIILDNRPQAYHECYFSRKSFYSLNVMIICDDKNRVLYYNAGWPGSTHDNRVFRNSDIFTNREDYFSEYEYLLGDSAYSSSSVMVQSFKKEAAQAVLPGNKGFFNTALAQVRICSEHCIGMLKGRFQCMKRNNIKLKHDKQEVKELVELIGACIIMHNLLINYNEDEIPSSWYDEMENNIDWTLYDEEEEDIGHVRNEGQDRRQYVFNSLVNNYL